MKNNESRSGKSPSKLIDARIKELGNWRGELLSRLRALVKEADPEIVEEWKWGAVPVWSHDGIICTGETYKSVVKMTFAKGAALEDPSGLFNSSLDGITRRAIDFLEGQKVDEEALKALIRAAVTLNRSAARRGRLAVAPRSKSKPESPAASIEPGPTQQRPNRRKTAINPDTVRYNASLAADDQIICRLLAQEIDKALPEAVNRIGHGHPVWFLDGNPVVGYSKMKGCIRLLFWSGQSFKEEGLTREGKFKAPEIRYTAADQIDRTNLERWLAKARDVQWDYKNVVRRGGRLEGLK